MVENKLLMRLYRLGELAEFTEDGDGPKYLVNGWGGPEGRSRWTIAQCATLKFQLTDLTPKDLLFRLCCRAFAPTKEIDHQRVEVRVNDQRVATWTVRGEQWYEAGIPAGLVVNGKLVISLLIGRPVSPASLGLSADARALGLLVSAIEVSGQSVPILDWIGADADPIGQVLRKDGNYYRAIRKTAMPLVKRLLESKVYQTLADKKLIPSHSFVNIHHSKFGAVAMTRGAHWDVFPGRYVYQTLRDAAGVWLDINDYLLSISTDSHALALIDGHYGNFALFGNSRPMWVDTGSIMQIDETAGDDSDKFNGWFGIDQFVLCFLYPLFAMDSKPEAAGDVRARMFAYPGGFTHENIDGLVGRTCSINYLAKPVSERGSRKQALATLRDAFNAVSVEVAKTSWSSYRDVSALEHAAQGLYLGEGEDSRFRAVIDLVRRSGARTFVDIGGNDGLFSILCAREGRSGLVTDVDDIALNRLYEFIGNHQGMSLCVANIPFLEMDQRAELVMALAVSHHLYLSQGVTFEVFSQVLAANCLTAAITEFMPDGLGGTPVHPKPSPDPLPDGYSLQAFLLALRKSFAHVEVIDYARPNASSRRTLVFCEKKL